jgi:hypothetical protein
MSSPNPSLIPRLALAFILAVGFALPYGFAVGWLHEVRREILQRDASGVLRESISVGADGAVLIAMQERNRFKHRTLDGEPTSREAIINPAPLRAHADESDIGNDSGWEGRVVSFADATNPPTYWYFVATDGSSQGRGHFVGYNSATRAITGYITTKGFSMSAPAKDDEFSIDGRYLRSIGTLFCVYRDVVRGEVGFTPGRFIRNSPSLAYAPWIVFLHAGGRFLQIDLAERRVTDFLGAGDVTSAGQIMQLRVGPQGEITSWQQMWRMEYVIRRPDRIVLFNPGDGEIVEYSLPSEIRDEAFLFYVLPNGEALVDIGHWNLKSTTDSHDLVWFNRAGNVTQRRTIAIQARNGLQSTREESFLAAAAVPAPLVLGILPFLTDPATRDETLSEIISESWPAMLLVLLVAIGLTVATDHWQRRYHLPRSYGWLAFVFLLGLPGFVGYLLHRRWPVRHLAPPPVRTGLEVFA